jgi:GT2 family glycosyltransferase
MKRPNVYEDWLEEGPMHRRISVVVACFDQTRELELTLLSFLQQSLPHEDYELIVVDDHSPDHSAREVVAGMRRRFSRATVLYARQHRSDGGQYGASAAVKNIGLRLARGEYVFFNNAEITQAGESLSHILAAMDAAGRPLCLRGRVLDLPYEELVGRSQAHLDALHDRTDRARERVATADHAGLAAVRRSILLRVGGNDERFDYWGKEDLDLAARLKRAGVTYVYDEGLKSFHISHPPNHVKQGDYQRMCRLLEGSNRLERIEANPGQLWGQLQPPPAAALDGTVVVEAGAGEGELERTLEELVFAPGGERREVLVACLDVHRPAVEALVEERFRPLRWISLAPESVEAAVDRALRGVRTERIATLPAGAGVADLRWAGRREAAESLLAWLSSAGEPAHGRAAEAEVLR